MQAPTWRRALIAVVAIAVFLLSWPFRFNDPGGSFAGLTDDHFFYVVRGWQILFGDLPVRDFVDHGAPLHYYVAAAVQVAFGRGTASELIFSTTALSLSAALTFWLATRASGSIWAGLAACLLHVWLGPRFYNYPKVLVYAVAIPLLWWFADRPGAGPRFWIAVITAIGFLFRHDHGVFIAVAMAAQLLFMTGLSWSERWRHGAIYALLVLACMAPYLAFLQWNGGVASYFRQASEWAERDRGRDPMVWPGLFDNPDGVSMQARQGTGIERAVAVVRDNRIAWLFYFELALPFVALGVLALSASAFRPVWPQARAKLAMTAVLAAVLDAGFLRSPLEGRLADPSVPLAVLVAWLLVALPVLVVRPDLWQPSARPFRWTIGAAAAAGWVAAVLLLTAIVTGDLHRRLEKAIMTSSVDDAVDRARTVTAQLRQDWDLVRWTSRPDRPDLITLSTYINECTQPSDRIFVSPYLPQVLALARRGFAGGHADLRPGFFEGDDAQRLTVERLQRQSVPVVLLGSGTSLEAFREAYPIVSGYLDRVYRPRASHVFDDRFDLTLFTRRDRTPTSVWQPLGWPCFEG